MSDVVSRENRRVGATFLCWDPVGAEPFELVDCFTCFLRLNEPSLPRREEVEEVEVEGAGTRG